MDLKDITAWSIILFPFGLMVVGIIYNILEPYIEAREIKKIRDKEDLEKLYSFEDYEK